MKKILFWFIVAMLSVYSAEVIAGSFMFPFFRIWGWFVLVPLYGLHVVVLAALVLRSGRPRLSTLYLAGMLLGLYEAYITKVLWASPWGPLPQIAHVGILETLILVFWWHPLMAFIFPVVAADRFLTKSRTITLPRWLLMLGGGGILVELALASNVFSPPVLLASWITDALVLGCVIGMWRLFRWHKLFTLKEAAPSRQVLVWLFGALLALYVVLSRSLAVEHMPPISGQVGIWVMYAVIGTLFFRSLRRKTPS